MLDILSYDFMQRAVMAVVAISIFAPILGIFLILRRQSLMSDTLSHVSLAGVAFGVVLGISPPLTTIIVVVLAAILLEYLRVVYKHYMEISTAILMSLGLALSLIIMSKSTSSSNMSLEQYLFGSIITISMEQVFALFVIAVIILVLTILFIRPMYILTFDEDTAFVDGLPVRLMSVLFNIVTGVAIALTIPAAGALLVSTIMVLPASIAMRLGKNFKTVILLGIVIGFSGMLSGIFLSYFFETPASATITMIFISIFLIVSLSGMLKKRLV
ncbi:metal ABC transporter permease [Streptococcus canis]|uniref:metal ABC transporter permease n=1 Tax=Streptococcus canis TaxID=1329 RepID=UPI0040366892